MSRRRNASTSPSLNDSQNASDTARRYSAGILPATAATATGPTTGRSALLSVAPPRIRQGLNSSSGPGGSHADARTRLSNPYAPARAPGVPASDSYHEATMSGVMSLTGVPPNTGSRWRSSRCRYVARVRGLTLSSRTLRTSHRSANSPNDTARASTASRSRRALSNRSLG